MTIATAQGFSNIAFIKYWGNRDNTLNLPANGSISMNLANLQTVTTVQYHPQLTQDTLEINKQIQSGLSLVRARRFMNHVRQIAKSDLHAHILSKTNFPISAGLASSASAFAALAMAATAALGLILSERELSSLARLGSGSAARSIPTGFVEWYTSDSHTTSFAESIAPPDHWDISDVIVIIQKEPKTTTSLDGHSLARTSPYQSIRVKDAPERLDICRRAILERDFDHFTEVVEMDSLMMHAVMMTSRPALFYWEPLTLQIIKSVTDWRNQGLKVCATVDAGANVHLICPSAYAQNIKTLVEFIPGVQSVILSNPGGPSHLV